MHELADELAKLNFLILQWLFRRKKLPYGAHLIFSLHYLSFEYLLTVPVGVSVTFGPSEDVAAALALLLLGIYLVPAMKRVYKESTGSILLKAGVLFFFTIAINYAVSLVAIWVTIALV